MHKRKIYLLCKLQRLFFFKLRAMVFMTWYKFKIKGRHQVTRRWRTIEVIARSETSAKEKALAENLLPPFTCEQIPFAAPTQRQKEKLQAMGIEKIENLTKDDAECILHRKNDCLPSAGLMAFAEQRDFYFSPYIGNKDLYLLIFTALPSEDKCAFFAFCLFRFFSGDKKNNLDTHPWRALFYRFATTVCHDSAFLRSLQNYRGPELSDCRTLSSRTLAYKTAKSFLEKNFTASWQPLSEKNTQKPLSSPLKREKKWPGLFIIEKGKTVPPGAKMLQKKVVTITALDDGRPLSALPFYEHAIPFDKTSSTPKKSSCLSILACFVTACLAAGYYIFHN